VSGQSTSVAGRLCLYYRPLPTTDRWLPGDKYIRRIVRPLVRGPRPSGVDKVFINLCKGLDQIGISYVSNLPFRELQLDDGVAVLGRGRRCLDGYNSDNPIVAGIGLVTHPSEWPTLCKDYPVVRYLQHSKWANDVYKPYFGERCTVWPVGIDSDEWKPTKREGEQVDILIYDKLRWDREQRIMDLMLPIKRELAQRGLTYLEISYGRYREAEYRHALSRCRAMIFLCEHESQGLAYQEALSSGVPILAWDQGWCLDPNRFEWGDPEIPATSVPYFDERCGNTFRNFKEFETKLEEFIARLGTADLNPREYILQHLTLEKCAQNFVRIVNETLRVKL